MKIYFHNRLCQKQKEHDKEEVKTKQMTEQCCLVSVVRGLNSLSEYGNMEILRGTVQLSV